jgi:SulP family sulfate permease
MSASAVKEGAGARTQVANLVAWGATLITLLFLTPLFKSLPEAVLAALIIHAVWHVMTARKLRKIRQVSRTEFWLAALTLAGVLFIDVFEGMIIGVVASLLLIIYQSSKPHLASLGRTPGIPGAYSDLGRHPENIPVPGLLIIRLDTPMYYANALTVRDQIKTLIASTQPPPRALLLDAAGQDTLDITSAEVLKGFVKELKSKGISIYVAEVHVTVREAALREGLLEMIGEDHIFPTVDSAVQFIETSTPSQKTNEDE